MNHEALDAEALSEKYAKAVADGSKYGLDLGLWLPTLGTKLRPLVPGELFSIMADTGTGKSCIAQNIARCVPHLNILYFSLELPSSLMFERQAAMTRNLAQDEIEKTYQSGSRVLLNGMEHIKVCDSSRISTQEIEDVIFRESEIEPDKPNVVIVDYIGLIAGFGKRYERLSDAAEDLKRVAKNTDTVVGIISQVARNDDPEIYLHSAKDSGSIENSCGLVLGAWRDEHDAKLLKVKILKSTKGKSGAGRIAGTTADCRFDTNTMKITEANEFDRDLEHFSQKK